MTGGSGARTRLGGFALGALLLVTGCRVDTSIRVDVADDGSGTVTVEVVLDQEAAERIPDLAEQLRVMDLRRTGWEVTGPDEADDGGVVLTATKAFGDPDQLATVLGEVSGPRGPVLDPSLERSRSFAMTGYDFEATLDLSRGVPTFSDRALTQLLDDLPVGRDLDALEEELGAPLSELSSFSFELTLPEGDATRTFTWDARLGDDPVTMTASTEDRNLPALGLAAGAALALLLLVVLLVVRLVRRNRGPVFHRG